MTSKKILAIILIALFELLCAALPTYFADISTQLLANGEWFPLLQTNWNAFLWWRENFILSRIISFLLPISSTLLGHNPYQLLSSIVFSIGLFFLLQTVRYKVTKAFLASLLLSLSIKILFGADQVIIASLCWLPWLILVLQAQLSSNGFRFSRELLGAFLCWNLAYSANSLGLAMLIIAVCITIAGFKQATSRTLTLYWMIYGLSCLLPLLQAPNLNFQGYPATAHMGPEYGVSAFVFPLLGPAPKISFIDREFLRTSLNTLSALLGLVSFAYCIFFWRGPRSSRHISIFALALAAVVMMDLLLPEAFAHIAPLASASRLVPGLFLIPAATLLIPLIALLLVMSHPSLLTSVLLVLVFTFAPVRNASYHLPSSFGRLISIERQDILDKFSQLNPKQQSQLRSYLYSPSFQVINDVGFLPLWERQRIEDTEFSTPSVDDVKLSASINPESTPVTMLLDRNPATRWSSGGAQQTGHEWLYIKFTLPATLSGFELVTGNYFTDFARGLELSTFSECPDSGLEASTLKINKHELVVIPNWAGALAFTSLGYPFYFPQHTVQIYLPHVTTLNCVLIKQTGKSNRYDWSIADFKIGKVLETLK